MMGTDSFANVPLMAAQAPEAMAKISQLCLLVDIVLPDRYDFIGENELVVEDEGRRWRASLSRNS